MRHSISPAVLDQGCKPYPELFSSHENGEAMKHSAFSPTKRGAAEKCKTESIWLQKGSRCSVVHKGERKEITKQRNALSKEQVEYYTTSEGIADLNKKGIYLAVEKRVALFFQQAILCYKMSDFIFSARGADAQIGTAPGLKLTSSKTHFRILEREAAHSSTIPTLIAHAKDGSTPDGIVYLKGGGSYHQHNATIGMHESVNGADELIDGKGNDDKLRAISIKILNRVAQGLDPVKATKEFCIAFQKQVHAAEKRLSIKDTRKKVLALYAQKMGKIQEALDNPISFDRLLGIIVNPSNPHEKKLRKVVYQKRYDVIRLQEIVESRIAKRIADEKAKMQPRDQSFLEYMLLKEFSETSERKVIEKLLGKTASFLEIENPSAALKGFQTRIDNLRKKYPHIISILIRDLRSDFRELSCAEFTYRAGVFKDLRTKVNDWTQIEFQNEYKNKTGLSISQSWVSRMEQLSHLPLKATYVTPINQRRRYVSIEDGQRCAETFGVDPGVFLPCLFTS